MKKILRPVATCIFAILVWGSNEPTAAQTPDTDVVVDGSDVGRKFYGAGAISAGANARLLIDYREPARGEVLDYLFKPGYGASLQLLKVEMGGGSNTTAGSDPSHMRERDEVNCNRGYQWWLMKEAKKRNPNIKLLAQEWTAPGWIDSVWSQDNINYHLSYLDCAEQHGLKIDYIGGWNEKGFDVDFFIALDKALAEKYPYVEIPAADDCCRKNIWAVADSMAANPRFKAAIDEVAVHWPCGWRTHYRHCTSPAWVQEMNVPLWLSANAGMGHDAGAGPNARALNRMYTGGKMSLYLVWNTLEAWYANLPLGNSGLMQARWPWSGYYELGKNIWAFAHTTQFTAPGWHYLNTGSGRLGNVSYVSQVAPSGEDYSTIIEALDLGLPDTVAFRIENLPKGKLHVWATNLESDAHADHFQRRPDITPDEHGLFSLTVRPGHVYSLTTTRGQGKGQAQPTSSHHERMPLPFREDFENVEEGGLAPFFSNINGAFEAVPCAGGRSGRCYQQMVTRQPVVWGSGAAQMPPVTMVGDPRWWGDYVLRSKVMVQGPNEYVELIGRVPGHRGWSSYFGGYRFQVGTSGWKFISEDPAGGSRTTLAEGAQRIPPGTWHQLALRMKGSEIVLMLDGEVLRTVVSERQRTGNVALRTSAWDQAQFDDVEVVPTAPTPDFVPQANMAVVDVSSAQSFWKGWTFEADNAIDDRPVTRWQTETAPTPHYMTLDLGRAYDVAGLTLRPRFDKTNAMITGYRVEVSEGGETFRSVAEGTWPATASTKVARWENAAQVRYVRLVATGYVGDQASASEIRIITAER